MHVAFILFYFVFWVLRPPLCLSPNRTLKKKIALCTFDTVSLLSFVSSYQHYHRNLVFRIQHLESESLSLSTYSSHVFHSFCEFFNKFVFTTVLKLQVWHYGRHHVVLFEPEAIIYVWDGGDGEDILFGSGCEAKDPPWLWLVRRRVATTWSIPCFITCENEHHALLEKT